MGKLEGFPNERQGGWPLDMSKAVSTEARGDTRPPASPETGPASYSGDKDDTSVSSGVEGWEHKR